VVRGEESVGRRRTWHIITETNRIRLVLFGMHNRTLGPYLALNNRILISVMHVLIFCAGSNGYCVGIPPLRASRRSSAAGL
jgi:hypothetical protein